MQLSLIEPAPFAKPHKLARRTDPSTSHQAAVQVVEFIGNHKARVVAALRKHGPMTVDEMAAVVGLHAHQINKRCSDAEQEGLIRPTGNERLSTSGRPEREWCVVDGPADGVAA